MEGGWQEVAQEGLWNTRLDWIWAEVCEEGMGKGNKSWRVGETGSTGLNGCGITTLLPHGTVLDGVFVSMGEICIAGFVMGV